MYESPRDRRLKTDYRALEKLKAESRIFDFECFDDPPQRYVVTFRGKGLQEVKKTGEVALQNLHKVEIRLGLTYPRNKPELKWKTEIFHPNISALGQVCLGGYGTNWVPSLNLDELCEMLWDMIRYANYDTKSPYNYKAARWVERQTVYRFPLDERPLKDLVGARREAGLEPPAPQPQAQPVAKPKPKPDEDIVFIEAGTADAGKPKEEKKDEPELIYIGDD